MFVPLAMLTQNEDTLRTPEDLILALDRWVLPRYPEHTSGNPAVTKLECMGVLNSFHQAGKFHLSLKPEEVEGAVNAFLEDRLWVPRTVLETLLLLPSQRPDYWMAKPTIFRIAKVLPSVVWHCISTIGQLISACATYTWYSYKAPRQVTVPNPSERPLASVTLLKKDS